MSDPNTQVQLDPVSPYAVSQIKKLMQFGAQTVTNDKIVMSSEAVKAVGATAYSFQQYFTTLVIANFRAQNSKSKKNLAADNIYTALDEIGINYIRRQVIARSVEFNRPKWTRKAQSDPDAILNKKRQKTNKGDGKKVDMSKLEQSEDESEDESEEEQTSESE